MRNVYGTYQNVNRVSDTFFVKVNGTDPYIYIYIYIYILSGCKKRSERFLSVFGANVF